MEVTNIFTFKALDSFMDDHQKNPSAFGDLYNRKLKLLEMVDQQKLDAKKYYALCQKIMQTQGNEEIKGMVDMQLIDYDGDAEAWFNQVLQETRDRLEDQKKLFSKLNKKEPSEVKVQKKESLPSPKQTAVKKAPPATNSSTLPVDPSTIFCFKVLDRLLEDNQSNPQIYVKVFDQKEKLIQLMGAQKINAKVYHKAVMTNLAQVTDEDSKFIIQMELDALKDFHEGNVDSWFEELVNDTGEEYEEQKRKYDAFKSGKKMSKSNRVDYDAHAVVDDEVQRMAEVAAKKMKSTGGGSPTSTAFCFKYLDEQMDANEQDADKYCQLFEKKLKHLQDLQQGKVDAQGYRSGLDYLIANSDNEELKEAAQMEIDLHDIMGDVNQFFQGAIEDTGSHYENQEQTYKNFKGDQAKTLNVKPTAEQPQIEAVHHDDKPEMSDIVSFTVLVELLNKYKKDYDFCLELKEKGSKLLDMVDAGKLTEVVYLKFLDNKIGSSEHEGIVAIMKEEVKKFAASKNQKKLFKSLVDEYVEKIKISLKHKGSVDAGVVIDERTVNKASPETKTEFLLRRLSTYESLMAYYKNNKMATYANDLKHQYDTIRQQVFTMCEKIKNGDAQDVDIREFASETIPAIGFGVLNREARTVFNEKIDAMVEKLKKSKNEYQEYAKKLKKGANKNNIELSAKARDEIDENIAYLEGLKKADNIPLPLIEEEKKEMYNLDINEKLGENDLEVIITHVDGVQGALNLRIYFQDKKKPKFELDVHDGQQDKVRTVIKVPPAIMENIIKGSDVKYLGFKLVSKGWFSEKVVAQADMDLNFIRTNVMEDRLPLKEGRMHLSYLIRVRKPKKPLVTEIRTYKLTKYPPFEHSKAMETEFLKTVLKYEKPTPSQIH